MHIPLLSLGSVMASVVTAAELRQVSNFGENPTNIQMYEYVPDALAEKPAIIVNVSYPYAELTLSRCPDESLSAPDVLTRVP